MTTYDSELMLTILAAVAQEESANLSKRVKFAKQQSAKEGRVPSMVYGYDKAPGDRFKLTINEGEARAVERIFKLYGESRMSPYQIAKLLNSEKVPTKRGAGYQWSQTVVSNILKNRLYIGQVCNKKSEVIDFINEERIKYNESEWITVDRPEFRIISDELFEKAAEERKKRERGGKSGCTQKETGGHRPSVKYPLSNLLICAEGNDSFRRRVRHGKKGSRIYWVCSKRDRGKGLCSNPIKADEQQMEGVILDFLTEMAGGGSAVLKKCRDEARRQLGLRYEQEYSGRALISEQKQLRAKQGKLTGLFLEGVISRQALEDAIGPINQRMEELEYMAESYPWGGECQALEACLELIEGMESKGFRGILDNAFLKSIFDKFIIYPDGKAVAYINPDGYNGHQEAIPFCELTF